MAPSDLEQRRLRATKAQLDQRWIALGRLLGPGLDLGARSIAVDAEYQAGGVWTGLRGSGVERVERNRGVGTVAPLVTLSDGLVAWIGYQEVWDLETGRSPFAFRQAGATVHVGEPGDPVKPQLLRLEWPGLRDWNRAGVGFQAPGAGHPHWQIDLFESLDDHPALPTEPSPAEEVESFDDILAATTLTQRIRNLAFERMHLASVAPWWSDRVSEFGLAHLHAPNSLNELTRWLVGALEYLRQELARCSPRR